MENTAVGEAAKSPLRVLFDRRLKLEFRGSTTTSTLVFSNSGNSMTPSA
jgi:hypothetical protein